MSGAALAERLRRPRFGGAATEARGDIGAAGWIVIALATFLRSHL